MRSVDGNRAVVVVDRGIEPRMSANGAKEEARLAVFKAARLSLRNMGMKDALDAFEHACISAAVGPALEKLDRVSPAHLTTAWASIVEARDLLRASGVRAVRR